jgi:hypothetical protein
MEVHGVRDAAIRRILAFSVSMLALLGIAVSTTRGDTAQFDLAGPHVDVRVTRAGKSLPIADVPNLQADDRIWIHPDLPQSQSERYLLIVAFLRGSTNPPPENWFTRVETWTKKTREEGVVITVPHEAQQALFFLAPETGGDFNTLRSAVRGKPGAFVRASQDLNQASLDRSRLDKYLAAIRATSETDPKALEARSALLARTLNIKVDPKCFDKPVEEQAACLTQNTDQLVLNDGHSQSMVAALTSGPSSDLIGTLSATPLAAGGYFSPYVGAVMDVAKIMSSMHTAEYQYIPALSVNDKEEMNLWLNNPPSFHNPKSVLVAALPAVEAVQLPPLRAVGADTVYCAQKSPLVLSVEGAPLVFSTGIAHDLTLHIQGKTGAEADLPVTADAAKGGMVVDARALDAAKLPTEVSGTIHGLWGFDRFEGPDFPMRVAHASTWMISSADQSALIVGREDSIHLQSDCAACVEKVTAIDEKGKELKTAEKADKPGEIEVQIPLKDEPAGPVKLEVRQYGIAKPDEITLHAYSEAAHLDRFTISAGDRQGVLRGTRLDEVQKFQLSGVNFVPAKLSRSQQQDELSLATTDSATPEELKPEEKLTAEVTLNDGRVLSLQTTVEPPRPKAELVSKNVAPGPMPSAIRLGSKDDLPQDGRISFVLKSVVPEKFSRTEKIEVAATDESFHVTLGTEDGGLILQDAEDLLVSLDPLKSFGASAFGPIRFRVVDADGSKGDWVPLAVLVRIPALKEIRCPDSPDKQCRLSGTNLYLIDSTASDSQFTHSVPVPSGFAESGLTVPRPNGTLLYLKLRDDTATVDMAVLPVLPE